LGRDQAGVVNAATRGVNRLAEVGEEVNRDEDPDGAMEEEELVGTLEEPPQGMTYKLEREPDGTIAVVLVADNSDPDLNTNDRTYRHRVADGIDPVLRRMNQVARGYHSRDAATMRRTMLRLTPAKGETVEIVSNKSLAGGFDVVLISPVDDPIDDPPPGAMELGESEEGENDVEMSGAIGRNGERELPTPTFRDSRVTEREQLKSMNQANARFWSGR